MLQFYVVYFAALGVSLLGIWILYIALYASVKQQPRLTEIRRNDLICELTKPSKGNIRNQASVDGKFGTSLWVSRIAFGKRFGTANAQENTVVTETTCHEQFYRKLLELFLAKTVRYAVVAFTLALVPSIIIVGTGRLNSIVTIGYDLNFSPFLGQQSGGVLRIWPLAFCFQTHLWIALFTATESKTFALASKSHLFVSIKNNKDGACKNRSDCRIDIKTFTLN